MSTAGDLREFPVPGEPREVSSETPAGIAAGPGRNLWLAATSERRIGRINPTGTVALFPALAQLVGARADGSRAIIARVRCANRGLDHGRACGVTCDSGLGDGEPDR
jgi:hypothetical protein